MLYIILLFSVKHQHESAISYEYFIGYFLHSEKNYFSVKVLFSIKISERIGLMCEKHVYLQHFLLIGIFPLVRHNTVKCGLKCFYRWTFWIQEWRKQGCTYCILGPGSIPGSGRSPGEGNGNPVQYSCLENPMDGGA